MKVLQNPNAVASVDVTDHALYVGCTDPEALNFNPLFAIEDGSCLYGELWTRDVLETSTLIGSVGTGDLLLLLDQICHAMRRVSGPCVYWNRSLLRGWLFARFWAPFQPRHPGKLGAIQPASSLPGFRGLNVRLQMLQTEGQVDWAGFSLNFAKRWSAT